MNAPEKIGVDSIRPPYFKTTPVELRAQASTYSDVSNNETDPGLKRAFASVAFALAQLAECIERSDVPPPREG